MQNHDHSEECKHLNLEFCPVCRIPYCKDCGKEWGEQQNTWVYPTVPGSITYTAGTVNTTGCGSNGPSSSVSFHNNHTDSTT
jgi:hypothetical protein